MIYDDGIDVFEGICVNMRVLKKSWNFKQMSAIDGMIY